MKNTSFPVLGPYKTTGQVNIGYISDATSIVSTSTKKTGSPPSKGAERSGQAILKRTSFRHQMPRTSYLERRTRSMMRYFSTLGGSDESGLSSESTGVSNPGDCEQRCGYLNGRYTDVKMATVTARHPKANALDVKCSQSVRRYSQNRPT